MLKMHVIHPYSSVIISTGLSFLTFLPKIPEVISATRVMLTAVITT